MLHEPPPLRLARLRFELRPRAPMRLPLEARGNALRGALGMNLRRSACDAACSDARTCARRAECPYARIFEPLSPRGALFGAHDPPRPFVFRPPLDAAEFGPRRHFVFELRIFGRAIDDVAHFILPLLDLATHNLAGWPVDVVSVVALDWMGAIAAVLVDGRRIHDVGPPVLRFDAFKRMPSYGPRAELLFITPTQLPMRREREARNSASPAPSMAALIRRVRDRISLLSLTWEDRAWNADYGAIGELADRVSHRRIDGGAMTFTRRSSKTDQTIHMTGFRGTVEYDGIDDALWPLLRIGEEIHAGRFTEWGLGLYRYDR